MNNLNNFNINKNANGKIDVMITRDGVMKIRNRVLDVFDDKKNEFSFCYYFIEGENKPKIKIFVYKYNDYNYVNEIDKYGSSMKNDSNKDIVFFSMNYPKFKDHFKSIDEMIHNIDKDIIRLNYIMGSKSEYEISEFKSIADVGEL